MSNVAKLPDSMERQWRVVASNMGQALRGVGHEGPLIDHVLAAVKPVYLRAAREEFRADDRSGEDPVAALNEWVKNLTCWLLLEIANREIELHQAGLR